MHAMDTDDARRKLQAAADAVEAASSLEVVVTVRARSMSLAAADLIAGAILGWIVLLFALFAPPEFSLEAIALAVPAVFVLGALAVHGLPGAQRLLTRERTLAAGVSAAAKAAFVDLGISRTRDRTGVLVYVALAENRIVLVGDIGVTAAVPTSTWQSLVRSFAQIPEHHGLGPEGLDRLVDALATLRTLTSPYLPRRADDVDELGHEVAIELPPQV